MKVFVISTYEDDTYSYSGLSVRDTELFATEAGARAWAEANGYSIVEYVKNPEKQVTLSSQDVRP